MIACTKRTLPATWVATVMFAFTAVGAYAQDASELFVKVYAVADLVFVAPDYPYEGPGTSSSRAVKRERVGGGGGGGGGGFGGGGGGGNFSVADTLAQGFGGGGGGGGFVVAGATDPIARFDTDAIIEVITSTIQPKSWDEVGGTGSLRELGSQLVVMQTAEVHEKIEQLLTALRKEGGRGTVTVRAHWLLLDGVQYAELTSVSPGASPTRVDPVLLQKYEGDKTADHGEITCSDGQTVHIVSGRVRSAVTSMIPVVGQVEQEASGIELAMVGDLKDALAGDKRIPLPGKPLLDVRPPIELLTQVPVQGGSSDVGYQPVITMQNSGVVLELTPTRLPGAEAVVLDLKSVATRWNEQPDEQPRDFHGVIKLDTTDVISQKLATTLRVPVGIPVVVGGLTLEPVAGDRETGNLRLYLVVEVAVGDD